MQLHLQESQHAFDDPIQICTTLLPLETAADTANALTTAPVQQTAECETEFITKAPVLKAPQPALCVGLNLETMALKEASYTMRQ